MKGLSYFAIFAAMLIALIAFPPSGGYVVQAEVVNALMAGLFTLLVWLITRLLNTGDTAAGIWQAALLTVLLCPGLDVLYERNIDGIMGMGSLCIVPFFIAQYKRVSVKDFKWGYFLMFFMGVFCSYTHPGLSIPLCLSFLSLSYSAREVFFRRACWPMVVGVVIGTSASLLMYMRTHPVMMMGARTEHALLLLWNAKAFIASVATVVWCMSSRRGRRLLQATFVENRLLGYCLLYSLAIMPFAPLGTKFAVEGVSLFGMFWVMLLGYRIFRRVPASPEP